MHRLGFVVIAILSSQTTLSTGLQDWNLLLHRFDYNSSNHDLLSLNMRATRYQPGMYALNGTAFLAIDLDDKFTVELKIYRSVTGAGQYKITPYQVKKQAFSEFIKSSYIPMAQNDFKECSNLPVFDYASDKAIRKGVYDLNMCVISNGGMPAHIQPGFYMIVIQVNSEDLDFWIALYIEAESKSMI